MSEEKVWGTWQSKGTKSDSFSVLSDGFSIKLFIAKPYSQHPNFKKEELLQYKHNSWIFDIAPKAYSCYSYKLIFFFSLGALKVYLMYQEKKKITTLLVSTASPRPDKTIKSASR